MTTRFRGAVMPPSPDTANYASLIAKNANLIRYEIVDTSGQSGNWTASEWKDFVRTNLDILDTIVIPALDSTAKVLIDIHTPAGGMVGNRMALFSTKPWARVALLQMWEEIAVRYKYNTSVWVYGILNEPGGGINNVNSLMLDAVNVIRNVDKHKRIAVTVPYCNPSTFKNMVVIPGRRIWYESHMYHPLKLTHQGLGAFPAGVTYPGPHLNKQTLIKALSSQREFQLKNKVRCYMGEFSISKFADIPSRINYLTDVIQLAHSYGWNWTYHAWRESPIWDLEAYPAVAQVLYDNWNKNKI